MRSTISVRLECRSKEYGGQIIRIISILADMIWSIVDVHFQHPYLHNLISNRW